jgi:hypothetical protein
VKTDSAVDIVPLNSLVGIALDEQGVKQNASTMALDHKTHELSAYTFGSPMDAVFFELKTMGFPLPESRS